MLRIASAIYSLLISGCLLFTYSGPPGNRSHLNPGDVLTPVAGETPSGKTLSLTSGGTTGRALVIFSFSRAAGRDAQEWTRQVSKTEPHMTIYSVIVLESVPRLFRGIAVSEIRSQMDASMQDRTILLYQDEDYWKKELQVQDESHACVILLGTDWHIRWINSDGFENSSYVELRAMIGGAN